MDSSLDSDPETPAHSEDVGTENGGAEAVEVTWNECVINAEDCRIKAVQHPTMRDLYLTQAAYWDRLAAKLA
jgi:hypothetical protein